jgi:hypothetical protein
MRRALVHVFLSLVILFTPGCGTIFFLFLPRGVEVATTPTGATLTVDGKVHEEGATPTKLGLWTGKDHLVEAIHYDEFGNVLKGTTTIGRRVRIWAIFGNILLTGGIGIFFDWLTGSMFKFEKDKVWITLGDHEAAAASVRPSEPAPAPTPARTPPSGWPPPETSETPTRRPSPDASECVVCGEPRGNVSPCPSCGME